MGLQPPMFKDMPEEDEPVTRVVAPDNSTETETPEDLTDIIVISDDVSDTTEAESTEDYVEVLSKEDMAERLADADRRAAETVEMFEQPPFRKYTKQYETKAHKKMRTKMQKKSRKKNR